MLDGEGGFCVWGKQTPADVSLKDELLPLGLAHNVKLKRDIPEGGALKWSDVVYDANDFAVKSAPRDGSGPSAGGMVRAEAGCYSFGRQPHSRLRGNERKRHYR